MSWTTEDPLDTSSLSQDKSLKQLEEITSKTALVTIDMHRRERGFLAKVRLQTTLAQQDARRMHDQVFEAHTRAKSMISAEGPTPKSQEIIDDAKKHTAAAQQQAQRAAQLNELITPLENRLKLIEEMNEQVSVMDEKIKSFTKELAAMKEKYDKIQEKYKQEKTATPTKKTINADLQAVELAPPMPPMPPIDGANSGEPAK